MPPAFENAGDAVLKSLDQFRRFSGSHEDFIAYNRTFHSALAHASGNRRMAAALCDLILEHRPHPEQGFRTCLGIVRLVKPFGNARVEAAATRALDIGAMTYGSVRSILDNNLDRHSAGQRGPDGVTILHPNIRGPRYYH